MLHTDLKWHKFHRKLWPWSIMSTTLWFVWNNKHTRFYIYFEVVIVLQQLAKQHIIDVLSVFCFPLRKICVGFSIKNILTLYTFINYFYNVSQYLQHKITLYSCGKAKPAIFTLLVQFTRCIVAKLSCVAIATFPSHIDRRHTLVLHPRSRSAANK